MERYYPTASVRLYGKVTYDQTTVARLTAYFPARIERLFVNFVGVPVKTGDHIAEVYSPELIAASEELRQTARAASQTGDSNDLLRESNRDTLIAAREKLRLYGLNAEQIRAIEAGETTQDRLTIYAPMGGIVTDLSVREGDYVQTGEPIATVADLSRLWLDLEAYESQLAMLRWGQPVRFSVESHPGETFEGKIAFIEPSVNQRTRTTAVRVAVDNQDGRLKPGMFASAVVRTRVSERGALASEDLAGKWISPMHPTVVKTEPGQCDVCGMDLVPAETLLGIQPEEPTTLPLVIPRTAVLFTGTRSLVYVEVPGTESPTYEGREVVLGPRAEHVYVVREGLSEGERVVVHGAFRVDSAMQIQAKASMMMPSGGRSGGGHAGHTMPGDSPTTVTRAETIPDGFLVSLSRVCDAYFVVQEALAADDFEGAIAGIEPLRVAVDEAQLAGLDQESRNF